MNAPTDITRNWPCLNVEHNRGDCRHLAYAKWCQPCKDKYGSAQDKVMDAAFRVADRRALRALQEDSKYRRETKEGEHNGKE